MQRPYLPTLLMVAGLALPATAMAAEPCSDYAAELEVMTTADQALRKRVDFLDPESKVQQKLGDHIVLVDRTNTERLKALMAHCGWPSAATHGAKAVKDAWLVVQHADRDLDFQKEVLAVVEQAAAASNDGLDKSFAYLYDRIAVLEKRPQHFGTQLSAPKKIYCALEFDRMDDRAQVEARRARLGMVPLDVYRRTVLEMQRCPVPPQQSSDYHYAPPAARADIKRK